MGGNKAVKRLLGLCVVCVVVSVLCLKLAPELQDGTSKNRLAALSEQQASLSKSIATLAEEKEATDRRLAGAEESLRATEAERDELAAELGQFKQALDEARQARVALEDMFYGYYMSLFYYDDQIGVLNGNNDVDGAIEMENRDGILNGVISFLDNPLLNMITADQQVQRGQISGALLTFNRTFAGLMDRYTPELIKITKMEATLDSCLTLAEEAAANPEMLYANMEIIRNTFSDEISPERFQAETTEILDTMLRIEACLDMSLRAYRTVLSDSSDNRSFLRELENLLNSTRTCYNEYRTTEMDAKLLQSAPERDEIHLAMLEATKTLMDAYCNNNVTVAERGPGISGSSARPFKAGVGYAQLGWNYRHTDSGTHLLSAFEYADTGMGSHMMAVHYYDMDGQTICIDSPHNGVAIYLKDGVVLRSTVEDSQKYIEQSQRLKECILYGDLQRDYFNGIHFETVHTQ